ncbi:MAG: sel1 repeat family protein [Dysgonamonadaceae bacterium]|jgi:TPR repeat protein|nr:sel1 repeat family protein [Dysgonamonadaceae bacterium]
MKEFILSLLKNLAKRYVVTLYKKDAKQGNAYAQLILGHCYAKGHGVTKDPAKAVKWYMKSAENGNVKAQYYLGNCYATGFSVTKDIYEAVKWWTKSAQQGDACAQNNLAACYNNGDGIKENKNKALYWYKKALEHKESLNEEIINHIKSTIEYLEKKGYLAQNEKGNDK